MNSSRICVVRNGQHEPMFSTPSLAPASPSPTLAIERQRVGGLDWVEHRIPSHVMTMYLQPCQLLVSTEQGAVARHTFQPHDIAMCLPERDESIRWTGSAEVLCVSLDPALVAQVALELTPSGRFDMRLGLTGPDARLAAMLQALYLEQTSQYTAGRLFVDGVEQALAALLVTHRNAHVLAPTPRAPLQASGEKLTPHCMKRVLEFIHDHLDTPLQLVVLAACAGLSEGHFSRLFRASVGATPHQFVLRSRIERAMALLVKPELSMIEIGLACGFSNPQHFSRLFHRAVGMPPSQFRRHSQ